jgi:hypothetical protein
MIIVLIFFGILLLISTILTIAAIVLSVLVLVSTLIALSFGSSRKLGWILLGSSVLGALLGALIPGLLSPLFDETPSSISPWAYAAWALLGYSGTGSLAGFIYGGIQAVLLPLKWIKSNKSVQPTGKLDF